MIIACFICSFYLGLAGEVGKTKLVLESGYGFGFGLVFVHIYSGRVEACRCHRVHMLRSEGKLGFQSTPSTTENTRLASLQTSTDSLVSISHLSPRAPAFQTITTVPAGPSLQPQNIWFLKTSFFDLLQSQGNILPLYHCMEPHLSDIFGIYPPTLRAEVGFESQAGTRDEPEDEWEEDGANSGCPATISSWKHFLVLRVLLLLREPILASREV